MTRRWFLGGAGTLIALPLLESALPRRVRADAVPAAKRLLVFYVPNGVNAEVWWPPVGDNLVLSPTLTPLSNVKQKLLVLSGLDNLATAQEGGGDHASGTGGFLTGQKVPATGAIRNGISMDQVAANQLKQNTRIPSLQLGGDSDSVLCDGGYSCTYSRNISWASETQPLQKTTNPQVVFDTLFAGADPAASAAEAALRVKQRKSVLDYALEDANAMKAQLGRNDRLKLDEYLAGVRELEKKIQAPAVVCVQASRPPVMQRSFADGVRLMCDLMVLAFECDVTRVITFMLGNAGSAQSYEFIGVSGAHHDISHHGGLRSNLDKLAKIDHWEVTQFAYLCERMEAIVESNGRTMLDNSLVMFSSELEDGDHHRHWNIPVVLAGSAAGTFRTNRHVACGGTPIANLFTSMLNAMDVPNTHFGRDGTGPLDRLA